MTTVLPKTFDRSILDGWLDRGLICGAGDGEKTVCIEQAVALCLGLPLTDHPNGCIAQVIPEFCLKLNDCSWSSNKARAEGMRELAYEQLGSAGIDEKWFAKRLAELTIREMLPVLFRQVAHIQKEPHKTKMIEAADRCEKYAADAARWSADDAAAVAAAAGTTVLNSTGAAAVAAVAAAGTTALNSTGAAAVAAVAAAARWSAIAARWSADDAARWSAVAAVADAAIAARWSADDAARWSAVAARWSADKFLNLMASICVKAIREAKQRAGIPLFADLVQEK